MMLKGIALSPGDLVRMSNTYRIVKRVEIETGISLDPLFMDFWPVVYFVDGSSMTYARNEDVEVIRNHV